MSSKTPKHMRYYLYDVVDEGPFNPSEIPYGVLVGG